MLKHSLIALAALGAGLVGFSATQASAFTAAPQPAIELNDNPLLTEVHRRNHHHRRHNYYGNPWWGLGGIGLGFGFGNGFYGNGYYGGYNRRYYGRRYLYDDGYYGGYYRRGYGSRHVAWCLNRYRSYDPRTNTWVSYSGRVRQCHSPYRY